MAAPKIKAAFLPRFCDGVCGGAAAAVVYCRRHTAFFCAGCDCAGHGHGHERVWVCEVCEQAPAAVTCRADAAALCESCDGDIHSANPLAHRHERRPIVPFVEHIAAVKSAAFIDSPAVGKFHDEEDFLCSRVDLMAELLCGDGDLLGFGFEGERNEMEKITLNQSLAFGDSVVPSESKVDLRFGEEELMMMNHRAFESSSFEIDFSQPEKHHNNLISSNEQLLISSSFNYSAQHSASSSETGVVPDGTTNSTSEVSYTFTNSTASAGAGEVVDGGSSAAPGAPAKEMDRKARVLRYREKRKNRKFQKTIRYASRKAYAETRPRIKGRFAKRTELNETTSEEMIEQLYGFGSGSGAGGFFVEHVGYGVVPSF